MQNVDFEKLLSLSETLINNNQYNETIQKSSSSSASCFSYRM